MPLRAFQFLLVSCLLGNSFAEVDFNQDVRPILSDKCFKCHGPDAKNQKSEFRLDSFDAATQDLGGYFGIVPGNLDKSEVHWRLHTDDPDEIMPPPSAKMTLTKAEREVIDQWIREGARYEQHWSFRPLPETISVPAEGEGWARNPIDRFVLRKLKNAGFEPSAEVSREKWLRRVTFDLTGLPPTIAEIDAFLADPSPKAHEAVVDRLLDSDAYAERMTSEWLDVARYSDTYGYQVDRNRTVWPWRDWVIRAFRENLPYDDFITWQVAGDLLPNATHDQILATCFNRLHPQKVEGGSVEEEFRIEYVSDRLHTFGTAFLGLTMECTRCHDHKYDPLTQRDYFSLSAFFNNIDEAGLYSFFTSSVPTPTLELPTERQKDALAAVEREIEMLEAEILNAPPSEPAKLIAHLSFEELAGGKLENLANAEQPASTNSNNQIVPGKIGNAIQLTGDDAVNLPKGVGDFTRDEPFSIALWIQTPDVKERAVVVRRSKAWTDAASRGYELLIEDGRLSAALIHFWPGNAIRVRTTEPVPVNTWTHVAVRYDGSSRANGLQIFVNGSNADTEIVRDHLTREIAGGGDPFVGLGQRMRDKGFKNGRVDEFRVYRGLLSSGEIGALAGVKPGIEAVDLRPSHSPQLQKARERRSQIAKSIPEIMVMREMPGNRPTFVLERGEYSKRGEPVSAATPKVLPEMDPELPPNRLGLAKWLTDPAHPLTTRVTVNRYWQLMFGRGLVSTSEDFGSQGKPPSHPQLLDWLSRDFIAHGWDLHHLLRQIALSATYRQDSRVSPQMREKDPENLLLARSPSDRLPAEMIRDNALAVSGLLSSKIGGPSVKPYDLEVSFKPMKPDTGENLYRRSVYTFWKRTAPAPVMMTLDASKRDVCTVKREKTASPLQSLVLLNGPQFVEAARVTAERLLDEHGDDESSLIRHAFRLMTSRHPEPREHEILASLVHEQLAVFTANPNQAAEFLKAGARPSAGNHPPGRLAATTVLISTLMNFDESYTKR